MRMNREWMYNSIFLEGCKDYNPAFIDRVVSFVKFACQQPTTDRDNDLIRCPCSSCKNRAYKSTDDIMVHVVTKGFVKNYYQWTSHGEPEVGSSSMQPNCNTSSNGDNEGPNPCHNIILEAAGHDFNPNSHENVSQPQPPDPKTKRLYELLHQADEPLWPGCTKVSQLSLVLRMLNIKSESRMTEKIYDDVIQVLEDALPPDSKLVGSFYETKKFASYLGLPCEKLIVALMGVTATHMRWHDEHVYEDGFMSHMSDAEAWKHFDQTYPLFAEETRNVRLGLCADELQPFGQSGKQYSCCPVIVTPYNLPIWMCMKDPYMFLTIIVPGPKNPKQRIDVFLQPLIKELTTLWKVVKTYDISKENNFIMRAVLCGLLMIFWLMKCCLGGVQLKRKLVHIVWRTQKLLAYLMVERFHGLIAIEVTEIGGAEFNASISKSCGWRKRSIFWNLPYWKTNLILHNLDVMHIEKNVFENVFETVMDIEGKTKDNAKARDDVKIYCKRKELEKNESTRKYPKSCYTFGKDEKKVVCDWVSKLKFPDGKSWRACSISMDVPIRKVLGKTEKKVTNKAKVESSIANAYLIEETSMFCSHYFEPHVKTKMNRLPQNDDGGNSYVYDPNLNSFDCPPDSYHPPHPTYKTYSYDSYGNDSPFGYDCQPQFPLNYESEPGYIENYNSYPYDSSSVSQQYPYCTHCGGPYETCQCDQLIFDEPYFSHHSSTSSRIEYPRDGGSEASWANLSTHPSKRFNSFCYDDDDDEDYTIAITPSLSTEEPDNSLSMGDEHLDTILATESDEVIKSSVKNLILIPSESEGIPDHMYDVPFHDNSSPLDVSKDQIKDFSESNEEFSSPDDDSFSIDKIDYVEASPSDSELVSSEVMEIVIPEVGGIDDDILLTIKDDILREKLLNVNLLIAKIEALNDKPTPSFDFKTKSSSTSLNSLLEETNTSNNSLPEFETFCFDVREISSGSTTTHSDIYLPEYEVFYDDHFKEISSGSPTTHSDSSLYASFIFNLSISPFPPADMSDFYEFADELIPFISPPEYDCFLFKVEPNSRDFTKDMVEDISPNKEPQVHNALPTHPTLKLNLKFQPSSEYIFTYVVWIFLPFLVYSVAPYYLLSLRNEDTIFDPGI
nr:hypothetical protein [Tanacetum cinerariifolium]